MRGIVHQIRAGRSPKRLSDLVQRKRRNRVLRGFVHQIRAGRSPKSLLELVQGKRRNRVLRGIVHQARAGRTPKRLLELVHGKRRNRVLRGIVHQVRAGRAPLVPKTWCPLTKEQGFAGSEAPRPARRQRLWPQRRGARRRKSKGLRGVKHHVRRAGGAFGPKDVVPVDESKGLWGIVHQVRAGRPPPRKALRRPHQKITKSVKTPGASGSVPLLSGLVASQYFLGFDGFKFTGSSYFPELSISSWMS